MFSRLSLWFMARQRLLALPAPPRSVSGRGPQPSTACRNWRHPAETEPPPGWPPERDYGSRQPPLLKAGSVGAAARRIALPSGAEQGGVVRAAGRGSVPAAGVGPHRTSGGALAPRVRVLSRVRRSRSACPSLAGKMAAVRRARSYSRCVVRFSDRELC